MSFCRALSGCLFPPEQAARAGGKLATDFTDDTDFGNCALVKASSWFQFLAVPAILAISFITRCMRRPAVWFIGAISGSEGISLIANCDVFQSNEELYQAFINA